MRKSGRSSYLARYLLLDTSIEPRLASDIHARDTRTLALASAGWACGAAIPARGARHGQPTDHALLETCALHRASLPCTASPCGSPRLLSLSAASGQRGLAQRIAVLLVACHLPISRCRRALAVDRSSSSRLCCQPCLAKASPRPHTSAASHSACAAACPARSSSYCHPPPDPCRTLGQPLCARCGGDPLDLVAFGLLPGAAYLRCSQSCSGRCAYVRLGGGNRSRPLPHCGCG
jgi:hypothetical protein